MDSKSDLLKSLKIDRSETQARASGMPAPLVLSLAAGSLVVGAALGWFLKPAPPPVEIPVIASTSPATGTAGAAAPAAGSLTASGYVVARRQATVAAEVTGLLLEVRVEEGQAVKAGDVLAVLESTLARADTNAAISRADSADADLAETARIVKRTRELARQGFASNAALTDAEARYSAALATRNAFRSDADRARAQLDRYEIRAPFDGVVVNKSAQPGEIISPVSAGGGFTRTGVCTIVDMASLEIEVDVSEAYIARVSQGQKVEAVLDAYPDWRIPAQVIATIPAADRAKATVRVRIGFEKSDPRILPEMAISVRFLDQSA
ncbi:MAG: efflux RND transporter periplasmic adaptor subunit [Parvularculaceae bacterium]|nr:efflux RND transporter periplasmic adaptor subunit [Parvularculaceae bacterium]